MMWIKIYVFFYEFVCSVEYRKNVEGTYDFSLLFFFLFSPPPPPPFFSGRVAVTQASVVCTVNAKKANEHVQQRTLLGLITCITLCYLCLIERKISLLLWNAIIITIQSCFYLRFEDFWKLCFNNRCSYYFIFQTSFRPLKCFY